MKIFHQLLSIILLMILAGSAFSAEKGVEALTKTIALRMPGADVTSVSDTPVKGLYEVIIGSQVMYMDDTARYVIYGDMVDNATNTNLTEAAKSSIRVGQLNELGEKNMLVYTPEKVKHTITVVTDIYCIYCRRLHSEMSEYMSNGIKVRYIFMPLRGVEDYNATVSVWCADDRNKALDMAKSGATIEKKTCTNPIDKHMKLAEGLGIRGTPAIIFENGEMNPGYLPVSRLVNKIEAM